ncbi:MAG: hypothetical protein MUC89_19455 [Acetobacteraceae bacterium]|jgi:hypothetical protein|nr:hypothetical protein [Acetobacteraceae bacterium]
MADRRVRDAHARFVRLIEEKRLHLGVNIGLMNRPGSPVFRRIETALPIFLGIMGVIGGLATGGFPLGLAALVIGLAIWFLVVLPRMKDQVHSRTLGYVTGDPDAFVTVWQAGALTLQRGDEECRSPEGDWGAFVRATKTREEQDKEDGL